MDQMEDDRSRRKSKLTTINNILAEEDPIIVDLDSLDQNPPKKERKYKKGKRKTLTIVLSSDEEEKSHFKTNDNSKQKKNDQNKKTESELKKSPRINGKNGKNDNLENIPPNKTAVVLQAFIPEIPVGKTKAQNEKVVEEVSDEIIATPKKDKATVVQNEATIANSENLRRSSRARKMSLKAAESLITAESPRKDLQESSDEEDDVIPLEDIEKPTEIFEEIGGKKLFGFQTPKKRGSMVQRAIENMASPSVNKTKTPGTPKTPRSTGKKLQIPKTPSHVRSRVKRTVADIVRELEDSDLSDFSPSESDFNPSESSQDSSSSSTESEKTPETPESKPKKIIATTPKQTPGPATRSRSTRFQKADQNLKSDDYFSLHGKSKTVTSDHTLDILKNPKFSQDKLNDLLQSMKISHKHEKGISNLTNEHKKLFDQWLFLLLEGFNVLLYGLGSKRGILHDFHHDILNKNNFPVLVVNGFFPSLVIKDIVDSIARDLLEIDANIANIHEVLDEIVKQFNENLHWHLFIIIHNIDGEMLRNSKTQTILSQLVNVENIHLLASIDHINAPLIWDHSKLSKFNFTWWDATTLLPYSVETSFEGSLLVQRSGALTLSSLRNIFKSLTTNARGIYTIIINKQIENKKDPHYQGMAFKDLYWACREAFLVSSDLALRAQLTEFLDHKLLKSKRNMDGVELLFIPIENALLQNFLNDE